jgi:type IV pilus assembly protein PilC
MAGKSGEPVKKVRKSTKGKAQSLSQIANEEEVIRRGPEIRSWSRSISIFKRSTVRYQEITDFLRQLIMLLESGTPLLKSLKTLAQRGQTEAIRGLINDIALYVEEGNPLWQAFDRHPQYFDTVFVNLVKASEASVTLTTVLQRLVDYPQRRDLLRRKVRGALFYPIVLVVACLAYYCYSPIWSFLNFKICI